MMTIDWLGNSHLLPCILIHVIKSLVKLIHKGHIKIVL